MGERAGIAALLACVALVHLRGLAGIPLDWDDGIWLFDPIRQESVASAVASALSTTRDNVWAPLLRLSFAGLLALGGGSTALVHATSLALYLGSTAGLVTLVRRCGVAPPTALVAVGLWALHPTKVEVVDWLTGLKDTESLALWVAAALAAVPARGRPGPGRIGVATGLAAAALLVKAATFPFALVLAGVVAARDGRGEALRRTGAMGLAAIGAAAVGAAVWSVTPGHPPAPWSAPVRAAWIHGVFWAKALGWTAPAAITPVPSDPTATALLGLVGGIGVLAAAWRWPARGGPIALLWLAPLLPFLGVTPMVFWASDRHLLLPSLGVALGVAWGLEAAATRVGAGAARLLAGALALGLAYGSAARVPDWHDSRRLWEVEVRRPGEHFARWYKVGVARGTGGDFRGAEEAFDRSLALWPFRESIAHRLVASLAVDGWTTEDAALSQRLEPPPADAESWRIAIDALRAVGRGDLADWATGQLGRLDRVAPP